MFTHLHAASGYSLRYGACLPYRLVERAAERGLDALALTDRDTLSGSVRFAKACTKAGVRPVFGVDLAVPPVQTSARPATRRRPVRGGAFINEDAPRIVLLARDCAGWSSLCRLISAAHARQSAIGGQVLVPFEELWAHAVGLAVLLGPASEPVRALADGQPDRAAVLLGPWREIFGAQLRLEAVHLGRPGTGPGSLDLAARTVGFAAEQHVPCVLTNAVRYADRSQAPIADVLDSARLLVPIEAGGADNGQRWLKDAVSMHEIAQEIARAAGQRGARTCSRQPPAPLRGARSIPSPIWVLGGCIFLRSTWWVARRVRRDGCCANAARRRWWRSATTAAARWPSVWRRSCR